MAGVYPVVTLACFGNIPVAPQHGELWKHQRTQVMIEEFRFEKGEIMNTRSMAMIAVAAALFTTGANAKDKLATEPAAAKGSPEHIRAVTSRIDGGTIRS